MHCYPKITFSIREARASQAKLSRETQEKQRKEKRDNAKIVQEIKEQMIKGGGGGIVRKSIFFSFDCIVSQVQNFRSIRAKLTKLCVLQYR